ncbi:MAG: TetR/AcrR family transcriptional regulator [Gemmatimonadales bacterium]
MLSSSDSTTRGRLLQAAGALYAREGVGATSVRAVIRRASANLNAIHYHFGSKLALTEALFAELMTPIQEEREAALAAAEHEPPSVRRAVEAVYWPVIRRAAAAEVAERRRITIVNQIRVDPSDEAAAVLARNQDSFAPAFEALLERATGRTEPELREAVRFVNEAFWGMAGQTALRLDRGEPGTTPDEGAAWTGFERLLGLAEAALGSAGNPPPADPGKHRS